MIHLGNVAEIRGAEIPKVDVITFGAPCQDLSIAGPRKGMKHIDNGDSETTRSGLFFEAIRIIREMRDNDSRRNGRTGIFIRPRFAVYENVPGAFSSNGGRDFQKVLTECARIAEPCAPDVPPPPKGKWPRAGSLMGDGWSVAWRVLDAQYWGVPQRRRRIALVCDFGGHAAPEILFVGGSLPGHSEPVGKAAESVAGTAPDSIDPSGGISGDSAESGTYPAIARTLTSRYDSSPWIGGGQNVVFQAAGFKGGQSKDGSLGYQEEVSPTLNAGMSALEPTVYDARGNGDGKTVCTLTEDHENRVTDYTALCVGNGQLNQISMSEKSNTLDTMHDPQAVLVAAVDCRSGTESSVNGTLQAKPNGGYSVNYQNTIRQGAVVRRLTPLECERLQGYPDGYTDIGEWTDSKGKRRQTSDAARYKALGNSIALPPWKWVLKRIAAQYERDATLGSLFDGIGGFPLIWTQLNGSGSVLWASEIEPFCIAVSKKHLGDSQTGQQGDLYEFLFKGR